jgi:hypothetical protein
MLGSLICGVYRIENATVNSGWKSKNIFFYRFVDKTIKKEGGNEDLFYCCRSIAFARSILFLKSILDGHTKVQCPQPVQ